MERRQSFVGVVGILVAATLLAGCGGSTKRLVSPVTSYTGGTTAAAVSGRTPPSKQGSVRKFVYLA